jgi:hypothetical protein
VADEKGGVGRRRRLAQRADVLGESREAEPAALVVEQIERRRDRPPGAAGHRRERNAAIAGDDRGDALADLGRHLRRRQHQPVVVGVRIDETRRDDLARGVDLEAPRAPSSLADAHDTVALHRDVRGKARRARAVDDGAVADDEVEALGHVSSSARGPAGACCRRCRR